MYGCKEEPKKRITLYADVSILSELNFGIVKLRETLSIQGISLTIAKDPSQANIKLEIDNQKDTDSEKNDGYSILKSGDIITLSSECNRGLLYGLFELKEQLSNGIIWNEIQEKHTRAHHDFRAIKFNLPWYPYRSGEHLNTHIQTCKDLKYWEYFLDMMLENKFNALTLWNMHPYMYMVKSKSFPKASPFSDEEIAEWEIFWKSLFKMAKDRGIDTYIVNWNIFLPELFSKEYGGGNYSSEAGVGHFGDGETNQNIEDYTREVVTQTLNTYEDLTGIGITLGERMGGMTSEKRRDWADRSLIAGLKAANRKARLIYR
ncbi:hypothetical protein J8H85_13890, partial [Mariniflexile gromovii]|nr:hypothetical protein [Mariniflexile gromovii]